MTQTANLLSTMAKFIVSTFLTDTYWLATFPGARIFEEIIPLGVPVQEPAAMFVLKNSDNDNGNFGYLVRKIDLYQIKGVVEGADFSLLDDMADQINRLFDWQSQEDPDAGRPRCQEVYTDPDKPNVVMMIMSMIHFRDIKFPTFVDGINYCHLGAEFEIQYYQITTQEAIANAGWVMINQDQTLVRPTTNLRYFVDTNTSDIHLTMFSATGGKQDYQFINVGSHSVILTLVSGDVILGGSSTYTIPAYSNATLTDYETQNWSLDMAYIPGQNTTDAIVNVSATATLTMPTQNTVYAIATTASAVVITLPVADGSGKRLVFDWVTGANALSFVLNGSDTFDTPLPNLAGATGISFTLRSYAAGKWAVE